VLDGLNEEQYEAVTAPEKPILVVAGAGSGKTRVLTHRIAFVIAHRSAPPSSILAITFTNKAAEEMLRRVEGILGARLAGGMWVRTFHSACARILRQYARYLGIPATFTIYDESETTSLLRSCLKDAGFDPKVISPGWLRQTISAAKSELISVTSFFASLDHPYKYELSRVAEDYEQRLRAAGALDFDDLLVLTVRLLEEHPAILSELRSRFRHILVDEFQDTNRAQWEIVRLLGESHRSVFCVGDHDQSIYRFRGADYRNLDRFLEHFPDAEVLKLERNYRSTQVILDAANAIIAKNPRRIEKRLWTSRTGGSKIVVYEAANEHEEAAFVASEISRLVAEDSYRYGDFAVFYRTNAQSRSVEEALVSAGIPYRVVGNVKFYERKEIKDVLAYARILLNPADDQSFLRIVNVPKRGIGPSTVDKLARAASAAEVSMVALVEAIAAASTPERSPSASKSGLQSGIDISQIGLQPKQVRAVSELGALISELRAEASESPSVESLLRTITEKTGISEEYESEDTPEAHARLENLDELLSVARRFDELADGGYLDQDLWAGAEIALGRLAAFLEQISLVSDADDVDLGGSEVQLMTVHNAKGLEFPVVFVVGMEEGLFPHSRSMEDPEDLEEERRLCYVAISRACDKLYLTRAFERMLYGVAMQNLESRFLEELPESTVERRGFYAETSARSAASRRGFVGGFQSPRNRLTDISVGEDVVHPKYGEGVVVKVTGTGEDAEAVIRFRNHGEKRFLVGWAPLRRATTAKGSVD